MDTARSPTSQLSQEHRLSDLFKVVQTSLLQIHKHPALAWMTPRVHVRLIDTQGDESVWLSGGTLTRVAGRSRTARFTAIELPTDLALVRNLDLPLVSDTDLRDAVALDLRESNPFEPSDLAWGYRATAGSAGHLDVTVVLASRQSVTQYLQRPESVAAASLSPEIWVMTDDGHPVVLQGFGEGARARRVNRSRWLGYALVIAGFFLGAAIAVTPTVQLRVRTLQAVAAYQALQQRAAPAIAQREALARGRDDIASLKEVMGDHVDPLLAVDMLTQLIPDDTWLQRVQVHGMRITLTGQTPNAAALMNSLSGHAGLQDVQAPSAATRAPGNRENFVLEFTVAPALVQRPSTDVASPSIVPASAPGAAPASRFPTSPVGSQQ